MRSLDPLRTLPALSYRACGTVSLAPMENHNSVLTLDDWVSDSSFENDSASFVAFLLLSLSLVAVSSREFLPILQKVVLN